MNCDNLERRNELLTARADLVELIDLLSGLVCFLLKYHFFKKAQFMLKRLLFPSKKFTK